jgi:membrane-associated phospholipid phosphatase
MSSPAPTSGAASEVLARYFPQAARELRSWATEAAVSRLYGGVHFRSDDEAGLVVGERVATPSINAYGVVPLRR